MKRAASGRWLGVAILSIFMLKLGVDFWIIPEFKDRLGSLYTIGPADNYSAIAKNIDLGFGYRFLPDTALTLEREPGYPYFLAALRGAFDVPLRQSAIAANLLLSSLCAWLVSRLARRFHPGDGVPVIAPLLFLLHPGVIGAELRIGVEMAFTALLLCFFLMLRRAMDRGSARSYVQSGLVLGLASCVRSTALLFPAFMICLAFPLREGVTSLARWAGRAALVLSAALLVLTPWMVRNYHLVGQVIPTASVGGISMQVGAYICEHDAPGKSLEALDFEAAAERNDLAAAQGYRFEPSYYQMFYEPRDEVRFNDSLAHRAMRFYLSSPGRFARCAAHNVLNFWFAGKSHGATLANIIIEVPFLLLAAAGLRLGRARIDRRTLAMALLFIAYTLCVYAPIHALARYSVPLVPLVCLCAAIPIGRALRRLTGNSPDSPYGSMDGPRASEPG